MIVEIDINKFSIDIAKKITSEALKISTTYLEFVLNCIDLYNQYINNIFIKLGEEPPKNQEKQLEYLAKSLTKTIPSLYDNIEKIELNNQAIGRVQKSLAQSIKISTNNVLSYIFGITYFDYTVLATFGDTYSKIPDIDHREESKSWHSIKKIFKLSSRLGCKCIILLKLPNSAIIKAKDIFDRLNINIDLKQVIKDYG